jgi:hypothetical protein
MDWNKSLGKYEEEPDGYASSYCRMYYPVPSHSSVALRMPEPPTHAIKNKYELVPKHMVGGGGNFHCELQVHNDPSPPGDFPVDSAIGVHEPGTAMFLEKVFSGHIPGCLSDTLTSDQKLATSLFAYRR